MSGYNTPSSGYNTRSVGTIEKVEESLALHIKKALSPDETAPKQKHVRACIVYSWDLKSSGSLWTGFKLTPILGDEVMSFKAMITLHKVIRGGHPTVRLLVSFPLCPFPFPFSLSLAPLPFLVSLLPYSSLIHESMREVFWKDFIGFEI